MKKKTLKQDRSRHSQISDWIRTLIEEGKYKNKEKLPSEHEISEIFNVSRVTVRRALQTLEAEGIIYRSQGLGSFVNDTRPRQTLIKLTDFNEDMESAGIKATSSVIKFEQVQSTNILSEKLKVNEGSLVTRIDRVRMGDGSPVAFDYTWLPVFYGQLLDGVDLEEKTIYSIFEKDYEIPIIRGHYRVEAENADKYIAKHLNVDHGKALLLIDRLSYTLKDKPVYYQRRYYNSERVVYELLLEREPEERSAGSDMPLKEFLPVFSK